MFHLESNSLSIHWGERFFKLKLRRNIKHAFHMQYTSNAGLRGFEITEGSDFYAVVMLAENRWCDSDLILYS
jgi:hypothetical protein